MNPDIDMRENEVYVRLTYREAGSLCAVVESLLTNFRAQGTAEATSLHNVIEPIHRKLKAMRDAMIEQDQRPVTKQ